MAAVQTHNYHHRDESTIIERACLSEIIGPANAGPPDPLRRLCNSCFYQFRIFFRKEVFYLVISMAKASLTHFCLLASGDKHKGTDSDSLPSSQQDETTQ